MPLLRKRRLLAAKIETTPGTAEALTAAEAAFNIFDQDFQPTIEFEQRPGQAGFSPLAGVPAARGGQVSFTVEVTGRGSSGAAVPTWASVFLPACGLVDDATGKFFVKSHPPGTAAGVKTLTIGGYHDGIKKVLRGCMGTFVMTLTAGRLAKIAFTFTGIWDDPTDVALLAPTYPTVAPLRFASAGMSIGSFEPKLSQCTLDLGNTVILREDANDISGYCTACITDRLTVGTIDPESAVVATEDTYGQWIDRTERALEITLGAANNSLLIEAPKLQVTNAQDADRNGLMIDTINYQLNRSVSAGDDDLTLDFG